MKLLIMRHGETFWNTEGRLQGQADIPLSEEGRKMAVSCGIGMREVPVDLCISSPLIRAVETADLVLRENREYAARSVRTLASLRKEMEGNPEPHPKEVRSALLDTRRGKIRCMTDDRLMEAAFGPWEGLICKAEGYNVPLEDFSIYWREPESPLIQEGVERLTQVNARVEEAIRDIVTKKSLQEKTVLLVVHGVVMRSVMYLMSGKKNFQGAVPLNCEVITACPGPDGSLKEVSREIWYDRSMIHDYYATMKQE